MLDYDTHHDYDNSAKPKDTCSFLATPALTLGEQRARGQQ